MNIKNKRTLIVENMDEKAKLLLESYTRAKSEVDFLNENGNTIENQIIYNFIGLNESVNNEDQRFMFENGMYVPGLESKVSGRLTLKNIAESAKTEKEFINNVSKLICEDKLMFEPTQVDKQNLSESYKRFKQQNING